MRFDHLFPAFYSFLFSFPFFLVFHLCSQGTSQLATFIVDDHEAVVQENLDRALDKREEREQLKRELERIRLDLSDERKRAKKLERRRWKRKQKWDEEKAQLERLNQNLQDDLSQARQKKERLEQLSL